jgi:hypothetical protein
VRSETAEPEPAELLPVTLTRIVCPTSASTSLYVCCVPREIDEQSSPSLAQRRHWKAKLMGVVPLHVPLEAVNVLPRAAMPEISGGEVLFGAVAGLGVVGPGT